jgi:uncharacterized DUF497 family protein/predicted DNA binding CopG/RHH family protein
MCIQLAVEVDWDPIKAESNRAKHGIDFADAVTALHDELAVTVTDDSGPEARFVSVGMDALGRLLVVVYTTQAPHGRPRSANGNTTRTTAMRDEYDFSKGKRGPVLKSARPKERITIRLDDDILQWFRDAAHKSGGGSYQTMINDALRRYITAAEEEPFEDTLRRVLREELVGLKRASSE